MSEEITRGFKKPILTNVSVIFCYPQDWMFLLSRTNSHVIKSPGRALGFVCVFFQAPGSTEHCQCQLGSQAVLEQQDGIGREQEVGDLGSSPAVIH